MKTQNPFQTTIGYPLTALVTTNFRTALGTGRIFAPLIIVLLPVVIVGVMRVVYFFLSQWQDIQIGDRFTIYSVMCATIFLQFIVPLLALLRGMTIFAEEKKQRTITYLFLRPVPRPVLSAGKFIGSMAAMCLLLAMSITAVFLILGSFPETDIIRYDYPVLLNDIWILCLGLLAYGSVMMFIGTYFKRYLLFGIILIFVWDAFASYIPGFAHRLTVKYYLQCIFPHQEARDIVQKILVNHTMVSETNAILTLVGITLAGILLTALVLKLKEFIGEGMDVD
ncbi:ABC transporter permease subunit [bacterium]|nr:ABC transporter permease subunit [bacterium]